MNLDKLVHCALRCAEFVNNSFYHTIEVPIEVGELIKTVPIVDRQGHRLLQNVKRVDLFVEDLLLPLQRLQFQLLLVYLCPGRRPELRYRVLHLTQLLLMRLC